MDRSTRRKWGKTETVPGTYCTKEKKEENRPKEMTHGAYDEYLVLLQERNRIMKQLKQKDSTQRDLERKEQGFSLYVNGANTRMAYDNTHYSKKTPSPRRPISRKTKTAGDGRPHMVGYRDVLHADGDYYEQNKSKTAPSQRKNWLAGSVQIKTHAGQKVRIHAPDIMTGNYDEDFDEYVSESYHHHDDHDQCNSDEEDHRALQESLSMVLEGDSDGDSDIEIDAAQLEDNNTIEEDVEGEINEQLMLSIDDVKNLRRSMELNASIRQSIAQEVSSEESDVERCSDIEEEDIEEDIPADVQDYQEPSFKPDNYIVLEFAASKTEDKKEKRVLSAPRKKDLPEPLLSKTPRSHSSKDILLKPESPSRKQRPLSATRRSEQKAREDKPEEASAVLEALRAENEEIEKYRREVQSAPCGVSESQSLQRLSAERPNSTDNQNVTDNVTEGESPSEKNMNKVLKKVLQMDPRQQKKLLKALNKIERSASPPKQKSPGESNVNITPRGPPKQKSPGESNVNITPRGPHNSKIEMDLTPRKLKSVPEKNTQSSKQATVSPPIENKPHVESQAVQVTIDLVANWGNTSRLGLTEIQFFDMQGSLVEVTPDNVRVRGASDTKGELSALFNGKYKTTKDRNMWSCSYKKGSTVTFEFQLYPKWYGDETGLSCIKIWNYNKSLNELSIGVKHTRVYLDSELIYKGPVEKGCGNQVFDYCKTITICDIQKQDNETQRGKPKPKVASKGNKDKSSVRNEKVQKVERSGRTVIDSDSTQARDIPPIHEGNSPVIHEDSDLPPRCQTRVLRHSTDDIQLPVIDDYEETSLKPNTPKPIKGSIDLKKSKMKNPVSPRSPRTSNKMAANLSRSNEKVSEVASEDVNNDDDDENSEISMLQQIRQITSEKKSQNKPSWLSKAQDEEPFEAPPESRLSTRPVDELEDRWPDIGKDNLTTMPDDRERLSRTPEIMGDDREEEVWRQKAVNGTDLIEDPPMKHIESAHMKRRQFSENKLEESWSSLSLFDKSHRGRISLDHGDDVLDEYIQKPAHEPTIEEENQEEDFIIPELPYGQEMVINIRSTWGDRHYVGLNGVELFTTTGEHIPISQIRAQPADINVLSDYGKDPRVVENLIDGVNRTRDDIHMWLAPFMADTDHLIYVMFDQPCEVALMRIWNYNKSRIHSYRGAKDIDILLDGHMIFKGEIARACGGITGGTEAFGDTILFTMNEEILEAISHHDEAYEGGAFSDDDWEDDVPFERPRTADEREERPFTSAVGSRKMQEHFERSDKVEAIVEDEASHVSLEGDILVYTGQRLELSFTATWGDLHYLGLTGLEVIDRTGEGVPVNIDMLEATPRDLRHLPGCERDDRTLDKLIDGTNITMSDEHMWLIPFIEGEKHALTITFNQATVMVGLRFWNYNKSPEDTFRGAKIVHVSLDGRTVSPPEGYLIRKGPGNCHFDFTQDISFSKCSTILPPAGISVRQSQELDVEEASQEYESVQMPYGFIYQFQLLSTWGDPYYVGLNGIQLHDVAGNKIDLTLNNISAYPESVNVLDNVSHDVRTPDKLIDDVNATSDGQHMWLAPILPGIVNRVFVIFDQPMNISMIKLWNYSKTYNRGVKDFALLVDDLLVYSGQLGPVQPVARGILPTCDIPQDYHTILFTDDKDMIRKEKHTIIRKHAADQDVQLTNDHNVVGHYNDPKLAHKKSVNQALRPKTSVQSGRSHRK